MAQLIHLIAVGKLKDRGLIQTEQDYLKRINRPSLLIHEVKADAQNPGNESQHVLKKINSICKDSSPFLILLTEFSNQYFDSPKFSRWFYSIYKSQQKTIIFILGGATGHGQKVKELAKSSGEKFALSKLTFPHQLARILFVEQFYRAQTIENNHPYHN